MLPDPTNERITYTERPIRLFCPVNLMYEIRMTLERLVTDSPTHACSRNPTYRVSFGRIALRHGHRGCAPERLSGPMGTGASNPVRGVITPLLSPSRAPRLSPKSESGPRLTSGPQYGPRCRHPERHACQFARQDSHKADALASELHQHENGPTEARTVPKRSGVGHNLPRFPSDLTVQTRLS